MIYNYKKYICKKFILSLAKVTVVFTSVIVIMNLFEEIGFFKNSDEFLLLPIYLTLLNAPSILFEIFPFIFLISTQMFFINLYNRNEIILLKNYGVKNFDIIKIIGYLTLHKVT